ncbi:MAG: 2,3-bisphosphoglycerate-independent phosphoglycerate mutase [Candidatus Paceibacterota bacterium]
MTKKTRQVALIILDGWGYREDVKDNAIKSAHTPVMDRLWETYPHSLLMAGEEHVGLPKGQVGNSEIGHTTIGAGTVIDSDLVRISKAADTGAFNENKAFVDLFAHVKKHNSTLHVLGLIGTGGVHAHSTHLEEFLRSAHASGLTDIAVHAFTDGRDSAPHDAEKHIAELEHMLSELGIGYIASVSGRFFSMDRDNNWDRLETFEKKALFCEGDVCHLPPTKELQRQYSEGKSDEHIEPFIVKKAPLKKHDGVFVFNFRADRVRMLTKRLTDLKSSLDLNVVTLTEYQKGLDVTVAFPELGIETTLALQVSEAGLSQVHLAETEKFPHATYFLNGGREEPHDGEEHVVLPSRKDVKTHDLAPEMRAEGIADEAIKRIEQGVDFIFINFANTDMVGHTANVPAIITATQTVDRELGRVLESLSKKGGVAFVTADHGNAEINIDQKTGEKHTAHTLSPVPAIVTDTAYVLRDGSLKDIAPTILTLLGLPVPNAMTGISLVDEK